ncbi:leucine-rich repeat, immunoglobulin-like domain and transmembrane domain-containing protein 2 [Oncorhynchus nerka]|uniref:leucine-rich repeat, immunoglobulin-like domain and transmembrane domain-containing protein 2 n=1 Tax=Oncorhynchus nerka TaxID=8023 RepID=UPI001132221C|nr:leucine-rich repeat, immunoglobulin-like domain and transmembrane domain-containing protein 2 [Oncorhynchus nerka]
MATLYTVLAIAWLFYKVTPASTSCLPGCSCTNDNLGRSLLCMETAMGRIPDNVPNYFSKIRIENSHLTEIPSGSFSKVTALASLWLNFNDITLMNIKSLEGLTNLTELRLQGNKLRSVPWTAFQDTPNLNILDLKLNRLDVLPESALRQLPGLTYLDLSFNQLTVISRDVFVNWPLLNTQERKGRKEASSGEANVVLALHDNPWLCDCRLKGFIEFIKTISPPLILMNSYLTCTGPSSRTGKFFHEVGLKTCMKPEASATESNMTVSLGDKVTLQCLVKARPEPSIHWSYNLKIIKGFTVAETRVDDETIRSQLVIPSMHLEDRGVYTCFANNFIGNFSVSFLINIKSFNASSSSGGVAMSRPPFPLSSADENVYIDIRISKQTVYGITLEWYAATDNPAETWFTIHLGKYHSDKKELTYIGPGINTYEVNDLLPVTKYEVCVTLKNQTPRAGQCIVFLTGSDISQLEQREKFIHIIVIMCAMVLAVPVGMYACTTDTRCTFSYVDRCTEQCKRRRRQEKTLRTNGERQGTFDSLQAASDEGLCRDSEELMMKRRSSQDKNNHKGRVQDPQETNIGAKLY